MALTTCQKSASLGWLEKYSANDSVGRIVRCELSSHGNSWLMWGAYGSIRPVVWR